MSFQRQRFMLANAILWTIVFLACFYSSAVFAVFTRPQERQAEKRNSKAERDNTWRGLIPLKSTRGDVEKLFGKPQVMIGSAPLYEFDKENVIFTYAIGNCDPRDSPWNVPRDTILDIEIIPQTPLAVSDTGFDLATFNQYRTEHPQLLIYVNENEGVTIRTKTIGIPNAVSSIRLEGSKRDLALICKSSEPLEQR